jgi:SOS-response transcriptional repressor LexA
MQPVIYDGYIIVVDRKQKDRAKLNGQVVVVHHEDFGLVVTRYRELNGGMLSPDNHTHPPQSMTKGWRIIGKVLWWIGQPDAKQTSNPGS